MKTLTVLLLAAALALWALTGCNKTDAPQTTGSAAPSGSAAPAASASTTAAAADIPSEEDFEDEAEKDITPDNLEAQLSALEKEVDTP